MFQLQVSSQNLVSRITISLFAIGRPHTIALAKLGQSRGILQ